MLRDPGRGLGFGVTLCFLFWNKGERVLAVMIGPNLTLSHYDQIIDHYNR